MYNANAHAAWGPAARARAECPSLRAFGFLRGWRGARHTRDRHRLKNRRFPEGS